MNFNLRVYFVQARRFSTERAIAAKDAKQARRIAKKDGAFRRSRYAAPLRVRVRWQRELRASGAPRVMFEVPMG